MTSEPGRARDAILTAFDHTGTVSWRELLAAIAAVPPAQLRLDDFARRFAPVHLVPPNGNGGPGGGGGGGGGGSGGGDAASRIEGAPHASTLPADHWLHTRPMDAAAPRDELGWEATPLPEAVAEYVRWLREGLTAAKEEAEEEEEGATKAGAAAAGRARG